MRPLYKLSGNSESLPLTGNNNHGSIPSVGGSDIAFACDCMALGGDRAQVWSVDEAIFVDYTAGINHALTDADGQPLENFTIIFQYSGLQRTQQQAPKWGYAFMTSYVSGQSNEYFDVWLDEDDGYLYIRLQRSSPEDFVIDTTLYATSVSGNRVGIASMDFEWLQNEGAGRTFKLAVRGGIVYFYIDDELICHQAYTLHYNYIAIGTRWDPRYSAGGFATPYMRIDKFEIYGKMPPMEPIRRKHVIRVYDMHEPQEGFDGNGLAVLRPLSCTSLHNDDRWDVELRHPLDDWGKWKALLVNNVLKVSGQLFRIDISQPSIGESGREIYVHAKHITCDLGDMLIGIATFPGGDAQDYIDFAFSAYERAELPGYDYYSFEGYSDISTVSGSEDVVNATVWALMVGSDNCLKNKYGGETFRNNFYFSINQRMEGAKDNAFYLRYSLDMVEIKQRVDYSNLCTNLNCYDNYGNYWGVATITPTAKLHHPIVKMVQFNYSEFEGAFDRLMADGYAYWLTVSVPKITYEIKIASLGRDPRYKEFADLQNYNYGDSGTIYCPELDIETTQRITEVEKDELTGDITRMVLGNLRESLSRPNYMGSTISSGNTIADKQNRANQNALMSQSIAGMEQFAISALEQRAINLMEG